jgi:hypothetical protein
MGAKIKAHCRKKVSFRKPIFYSTWNRYDDIGFVFNLGWLRLLEKILKITINLLTFLSLRAKKALKGTVSRDFQPLVFFTNQPHLGP